MANPHHQHPQPRKPRRVRVPSQRAQGLDPEFTALPHSLPDDIDLSGDEPGQALTPEDLGNHYLSEAVDQGDSDEHLAAELEYALEADDSPEVSTEVDLEFWEAEALPSRSLDLHGSSIRENSLLDREGRQPGETVAPRVDSDDGGRHARSTPRESLGAQVRGSSAAESGKRRTHKLQAAARASLRRAASKLRRVAAQLARARQRKT